MLKEFLSELVFVNFVIEVFEQLLQELHVPVLWMFLMKGLGITLVLHEAEGLLQPVRLQFCSSELDLVVLAL